MAAPVLVCRWRSIAAKPKLWALSCSNSEALLTTASSWPKCATTAGTRVRTAPSSLRSARKGCALPGRPVRASQSAAVCCASVAESRWCTATFQPPCASVSAISRPRRLPAPVTSTVRRAVGGESGALGMADNRRVETESVSEPSSLTSALLERLREAIRASGGWLPFDRFMAMALYEPGLGYYANQNPKFGQMPAGVAGQGSDFVTAPELSPLFGHTLARQVAQALDATGTVDVWEFGAGTGALALQVLDALAAMGRSPRRYTIVDLSGSLRERQRGTLAAHADRVQWVDQLPERFEGVVLGNEVLDAMPVQLLVRIGGQADGRWFERGVVLADDGALAWAERSTDLRPPFDIGGPHNYLTEIHLQGEAFIRTLADRLQRGAAFLIDYGFPEAEYYHPQRHMGTLICHRAHQSDDDPLTDVGEKDITAHVNFTGIALAAQEAGMQVLGYTSQGRFLINCGLLDVTQGAGPRENAMLGKLVNEHEMGELFKVIGLAPAGSETGWDPVGFSSGDRTHRL